MAGGYVGSIFSGLASDKAYHSFIRVGLIDADGVCVPVGDAQGWGACGGGGEIGTVYTAENIFQAFVVRIIRVNHCNRWRTQRFIVEGTILVIYCQNLMSIYLCYIVENLALDDSCIYISS